MKLNLGCGTKKMEGWVNVDKYPAFSPDVVWDLEAAPWPWEDNSAEEVALIHVLEHLGQTTDAYATLWKELYRVCAPGARVVVSCPHPRHDNQVDDPTHVRCITPRQFSLFDREFNLLCEEKGYANSQLGTAWGINFKVEATEYTPSALYLERNPAKRADAEWLGAEAATKLNQIDQWTCSLRAVKP